MRTGMATGRAEHRDHLVSPISCSHEHAAFPGTVSISAVTLAAVIADIRRSLHLGGVGKLVVVSGHGGNYVLSNVVQEANVAGRRMTLFPVREDWDKARRDAGCVTTGREDMHAGELEVSLLLHGAPALVGGTRTERDHEASSRPQFLLTGMPGYTATGVIGRPSEGTAAKGSALLDSLAGSLGSHFHALTAS
jgi:creatinine amidohydrolase